MKKLLKNQKYEFRNKYYADDCGHIWSAYKQDYLTEYDDKNGYKKVLLMTTDKPNGKGHRFSVHRLILSTFNPVDNMNMLQVDHIDGDITNNQLSNLRWTTCKENLNNPITKPNRRVYDQDGTHNASSKFTTESLMSFIEDVNSGNFTRKQLQSKYDICDETMRRILLRKTYTTELENVYIKPNFISDMARDNYKGENNPRAKLNNTQVLEIIELLQSQQYTLQEIASKYNVSKRIISDIKNKRTWTHLTQDINF